MNSKKEKLFIAFCPFQSCLQSCLTKILHGSPILPKVKIKKLFNSLAYKVSNTLVWFRPSDSSTDHRCLNNSPSTLLQLHSWLLAVSNTLNMLLPQGFCNYSICNTLLPNTHIACSLTCLRSFVHKPI